MPTLENSDDASVHEQALERRARYAEALFEGIDDVVFVHDLEGRILDVNPAACRRLGYPREELLRMTTNDIDDPKFAIEYHDRLKRQQQQGSLSCEGCHITKDGRRIPVDINTSIIRIDNRPAILAVVRDITARKTAERRLTAQYAVTRVLTESATPADAAPGILQAICENLYWDFGALWELDRYEDRLRCVDVWLALPSLVEFQEATQRSRVARDVDVPGRVWSSGKPLWLPGLASSSNMPRAPVADRVGLYEAFAFPIRAGSEIIGVVEFFSRHIHEPDDDLISMSTALGSQIGQFLERKHVEEALRDSEALYHSLVENLPQNIFRKDCEGRVTFANSRYCETLKLPLEQILGKTDLQLFPIELATKYRNDDRAVLDSGKIFETVEEHRLRSGEKIHVQVVKIRIHDAQGDIIGTQCMFWDVTARKRAEDAREESERRYRKLSEAALDAIVVSDQDGRITFFNPAAERTFGYQEAEIVGHAVSILMPDEFRERHQAGLSRYRATREAHVIGRTIELRGRKKDGAEFPLELSLSAIDLGDELQFLGAMRDLTERQRMGTMLLQSEKLASIGLLSAGMAHEINNPLAYVANNLVVLERDFMGLRSLIEVYDKALPGLAEVDPEASRKAHEIAESIDLPYIRDNLERILKRTREGVERMAKIVQALRGMARTDRPQLEEANLSDLVDAALELLRSRMQRRGIKVERDITGSPRIRCAASQIGQVLLNLLINAVQAIESVPPQTPGRLGITIHRQEQHLVIDVADNGCGIEAKNLPKIFDPFYTSKPIGEGTGLGLSLSHGIVTAHGGRIEVDSNPGQGSRFRVLLPLDPQRGSV